MALEKQYPPEIIETEHLVLKRQSVDMAERLFVVKDRDRAHLTPFIYSMDKTHSVEDVRNRTEMLSRKWDEYANYSYLLFSKNDNNEIIGAVKLRLMNWESYSVHVGYWLVSPYQGRGLMAEAVTTMVKQAFDMGFNRLEIRCRPDNKRSQAVARRCGFTYEGTLRQASYVREQFYDEMVFSRLKSDS